MTPTRKLSHLKPHKIVQNSSSINNDTSLIHDTGPSDFSEPTITKVDSSKEESMAVSPKKNPSFEKNSNL